MRRHGPQPAGALLDRRSFLALAAAAVALPGRGFALEAAPDDAPLYLAARTAPGRFEAAVIGTDGADRLVLPLVTRGHGFAVAPGRRRAVAFARELGGQALGFDPAGRGAPVLFAAGEGRHFYGHGAFSPDGRLLLATENAFDTGDGMVGVYDAGAGFRRIGEYATAGVGPHEALLLPDGRTLVVANGGIATHPDYGEQKLNLADMAPSLVYLDLESGAVTERAALPPDLHQLSIRHIALAGGAVWFGCQYEGPTTDDPPLVGRHVRGREPELFGGPPALRTGLRNYVGSVAADASGSVVAAASPRGGLVAFFDAATGASLGSQPLDAGCGLAALEPDGFLATGGGEIDRLAPGAARRLRADGDLAWDNHIAALPRA